MKNGCRTDTWCSADFMRLTKKIQNQKEVALIIKTCSTSIQIQRSLKKIHRYDTPIIVELKTGLPNKDYLKWFFEN